MSSGKRQTMIEVSVFPRGQTRSRSLSQTMTDASLQITRTNTNVRRGDHGGKM